MKGMISVILILVVAIYQEIYREQNKVLLDYYRSRLLGASICAVPLSQPIPVKKYF